MAKLEETQAAPVAYVERKQRISLRMAFLYFVRFLKVIVCAALLLDMAAYCLIITGSILGDTLDTLTRVFIVIASFGYICISVLLIIAEIGPVWFIEKMKVFDFWGIRGLMIAWQGVQTIYSVTQLAASLHATDAESSKRIDVTKKLGEICGWFLISTGLLYIAFSACWLRSIAELDKPVDDTDIVISNQAVLLQPTPVLPSQADETVEGHYSDL
eukprot:Tbor_TRINITY_DN5885_c5_g5::TRINITY_DN5885_c5_g5_i1::g.6786::m.6786